MDILIYVYSGILLFAIPAIVWISKVAGFQGMFSDEPINPEFLAAIAK